MNLKRTCADKFELFYFASDFTTTIQSYKYLIHTHIEWDYIIQLIQRWRWVSEPPQKILLVFVIFRNKNLRKENISRDDPYYVPTLHQPNWVKSKIATRWIKRELRLSLTSEIHWPPWIWKILDLFEIIQKIFGKSLSPKYNIFVDSQHHALLKIHC